VFAVWKTLPPGRLRRAELAGVAGQRWIRERDIDPHPLSLPKLGGSD